MEYSQCRDYFKEKCEILRKQRTGVIVRLTQNPCGLKLSLMCCLCVSAQNEENFPKENRVKGKAVSPSTQSGGVQSPRA